MSRAEDEDTSDTPDDAGGEVVVPDAVAGPGENAAAAPGPPARRDRRPLYALIAGLAACWFTLFGPLLVVLLAPAAIFLGRRALQRIATEGGTDSERKQARIGYIAGLVAVSLLILQLVLFQLFFEWEKEVSDPESPDTTSEPTDTTAPGGTGTATTEAG